MEERHRPEQTALYRLSQPHAASIIARTEASAESELLRFFSFWTAPLGPAMPWYWGRRERGRADPALLPGVAMHHADAYMPRGFWIRLTFESKRIHLRSDPCQEQLRGPDYPDDGALVGSNS